MASLKQLDERRYKITVSNGYRPDGRKVCKARTLHVPKRIPRRSVLKYVMHAAEELEKEFKYGYAEDGEKTFEAYARGWLERQTHYAPSTLAGYRQMLERVYGEIGQIRLKELRPITISQHCPDSFPCGSCSVGSPSREASAGTACVDIANPDQSGESGVFRPGSLQTPRPAWWLPC